MRLMCYISADVTEFAADVLRLKFLHKAKGGDNCD